MSKEVKTTEKTNLRSTLAGLGVTVKNIANESELEAFNASEFEDTGAIKIVLEPTEAFMGRFEDFEVIPDDRQPDKNFLVCHLTANKKEYFITLNEVMKKNIEKIVNGNLVIITCTGKDKNDNGEYKKYNIQQKTV